MRGGMILVRRWLSTRPRLEVLREKLLCVEPLAPVKAKAPNGQLFFLETRGCQMNVNDAEIVRSLLLEAGYAETESETMADVVLINTCAIRDKAEAKVWGRLHKLRSDEKKTLKRRQIAVLGCMAERVKEDLFRQNLADVVAGPDAYRDLVRLLSDGGGINAQFNLEETYLDVAPVRRDPTSQHGAFVSVQRGCSNMCSFCIVPYVRGRDRSREPESILRECLTLYEKQEVKEITLLGQNVNSYASFGVMNNSDHLMTTTTTMNNNNNNNNNNFNSDNKRAYSLGFEKPFVRSLKRDEDDSACRFAELLVLVAESCPGARIRFTSPHPKDFPDVLLEAIRDTPNIAKQLHLPAQSGSSRVLEHMRRGYTAEAYRELICHVRQVLGDDVALSSDFIAGFCGETEEDHLATLDLIETVEYDQAFLFAYSPRPGTHASRHLKDDVAENTKKRRLRELMAAYDKGRRAKAYRAIGSRTTLLVEGPPSRAPTHNMAFSGDKGDFLVGRNDANRKIIFKNTHFRPGDFVDVLIDHTDGNSLFATPISLSQTHSSQSSR